MNRDKMEEIIQAKKQVVEGNLVLWQTRLATISQTSGDAAALDILQAPVEPAEGNTNCPSGGGNCNCLPRPQGTVTLGEPTITTIPPRE